MTRRRTSRRIQQGSAWIVVGLAVLVAGCAQADQQQSALNPRGSRAQAVDGHWWTMLIVGSVVWVIVTGTVLLALLRRKRAGHGRRATLWVALAGGVIPAIVIVLIAVQSALVGVDTDPADVDDSTLIEVVGHQYWWEIRYPDLGVVTANEIHLPTGRRVRLQVTSADVIHSVWVPELGGKMDMIPGRSNTTWMETDAPGTYWGQCTEFCGVQHAKMRFVVVAHEPAEFQGWVAQQRQPAPASPAQENSELIARGREVFLSSSCVYCHAVAGTAAVGNFGPDLTHLASRSTLAAGILPNNRGNLAAWIVDPQSIKPGNQMPGSDLDGDEMQALLAYLESLD